MHSQFKRPSKAPPKLPHTPSPTNTRPNEPLPTSKPLKPTKNLPAPPSASILAVPGVIPPRTPSLPPKRQRKLTLGPRPTAYNAPGSTQPPPRLHVKGPEICLSPPPLPPPRVSSFRRRAGAINRGTLNTSTAALRIQRLWRGYSARKYIAQLVTDPDVKKRMHRYRVLTEIVSTEKTYFTSLFWLAETVIRPLKETVSILEPAEIDMLFINWETLAMLHSGLLHRLKKAVDWNSKESVGEVFLSFAPLLSVYSVYVNNFHKASEFARKVTNNSNYEEFQRFYASFGNELDMSSYLIMPIQRIPRYELLLRDLVKHSDEDEKDILHSSLATVKALAKSINDHNLETEQRDEIIAKLSTFIPEDHSVLCDYLVPGEKRKLLHEGKVTLNHNKKKFERVAILLSDVLLVAERTKDKGLKLDFRIDVVDMTIQLCIRGDLYFDISTPNQEHHFCCASTDDVNQWLSVLEEAHDNELARRSETLTWTLGMEQTYVACSRYGHTFTQFGDEIFLFGGADTDDTIYADLWLLTTTTNEWTAPVMSGTCPSPRYYHTTALVDNQALVVFGGFNGSDRLGDTYALDLTSLTWSELSSGPPPRSSHSAVAIGHMMYVFGGRGVDGSFLSDLWCYDIHTDSWRECQAQNKPPSARAFHSMTVVDAKFYVFGGSSIGKAHHDLGVFDTIRMDWQVAEERSGIVPIGRFGHAAAQVRKRLFFVGGAHQSGYLGETEQLVLIYDTQSHLWSQPNLQHSTGPVAFGAMATVDQQLVLFGGKKSTSEMSTSDPLILPVVSNLVEEEYNSRQWLEDAKNARSVIFKEYGPSYEAQRHMLPVPSERSFGSVRLPRPSPVAPRARRETSGL